MRKKYKDLKASLPQPKNEIISVNNLKKSEYLPKMKQNNNEVKISNNSNPFKQIYSVNSKNIYNNQFNNTYKNNYIKSLKKEERKIIIESKKKEQTLIRKNDEIFNLKQENITLKEKIENIEGLFFQFKNKVINDMNEIKQNNFRIENSIKSKFFEINNNIDNKINFVNDNIKNIRYSNSFEKYNINDKNLKENIENPLLKLILSDIELLKNKFVDNDKNKPKFQETINAKEKNELIELKNENKAFKLELEKLNKKNKEYIDKNEELKRLNIEFKIQNEKLNEEIKKQSEKLQKYIKQADSIIKQNEELNRINSENNNKNEKLIKQNEDIIAKNKDLKNLIEKLNEEIKKQNEKFEKLEKQNKNIIIREQESKKQIDEIKELKEKLKIINDDKNQKNKEYKNSFEKETEKKNINHHYDKKYAIVGLSNIGNNCYMNAVLQILKNIPQFTYNIINLKNEDNFLKQLQNLFVNLCIPGNSYISPKEFKKCLGEEKLGKLFAGNNQYDSNIFYVSLLNIIDKKLNNDKINKIDMTKYIDKTLEERQKIYKRNDYNSKIITFIFDTFYIYFVNEIKCKTCDYILHVFQKVNFLDFPIVTAKGKVKSLEECFKNYQKVGDVKDTCPKCKNFGMTHECILLELPPVIIINLKRVGERSVYFNDIEIPQQLDMGKIITHFKNISTSIYELRGFIKHDGDEKFGHNYAFCKNMFDDKWYEYNDDRCIDINDKIDFNKIFFLCFIKKGIETDSINYLEQITKLLNKKK